MDSDKSGALLAVDVVKTSPVSDNQAAESAPPAALDGNAEEEPVGVATTGAATTVVVVPHPSSLPLTRTRSYNILESIPTDVCLQIFRDRIVFCVSQVEGGRVVHWFLCECLPDLVRPKGTDFVTTPLLGAQRDGPDATEGLVYARQLCQELALLATSPPPSSATSEPDRPGAAAPPPPMAYPTVLLGISLHPTAKGRPEVFKALIQSLVTFYQECMGDS